MQNTLKTKKTGLLLLVFFCFLAAFHSCDIFNPDDPNIPPVVVDSLGVSISAVSFTAYKDASLIVVRTKDNWTASSTSSWISLSANSGKGNTSFLIGVAENPEFKREAKVTISVGNKSKEISISQAATSKMILNISGINVILRKVEGGKFIMSGSDNISSYGIGHYVTLSDFYLMETEVTNELWKEIMKSLPYDTIAEFAGHSQHTNPLQPISAVSWNDISNKFIPALNQRTGKIFKLPTEAQWEFAVRGGKLSQEKKYAGSDKLDDVAWYYKNSSAEKHDVGEKSPNELGLYDMSGNVSEWCYDWFETNFGFPTQNGAITAPSNQDNPTGPTTGTKKVVRGGSFASDEFFGNSDCNVRVRNSIKPNGYDTYEGNPIVFFMAKNTGFRLLIAP